MAAPEKYDGIDFKPPKAVAEAAERGLEYRAKANPSDKGGLTPAEASKQGIGSGVQRATNLKNRDNVSPDVIRQMCAFFARHEKNKAIKPENRDTPWKQKGYVAWLLWGGDPGKTWAEKVRDQMDRADEKADKTAHQQGCGCGAECHCMGHRVASHYKEAGVLAAAVPHTATLVTGPVMRPSMTMQRQAITWEKHRELVWEARQELKAEREWKKQEELNRYIERELAELTPEEREIADQEMKRWPDTLREWRATVERVKAENKKRERANLEKLWAQYLKVYDELATDMERAGWVATSTGQSQTYTYQDPPDRNWLQPNTYKAVISHELFTEADIADKKVDKIRVIWDVYWTGYKRKGGKLYTDEPIYRTYAEVSSLKKLEFWVEKAKKYCLGAILKHKHKVYDDFQKEVIEEEPASPGDTSGPPKWQWQKDLDARKKVELDRRFRQEKLDAEFLEEVGSKLDDSGWVDESDNSWKYVVDNYTAVLGVLWDWGGDSLEGWFVTVYRDKGVPGLEKRIFHDERNLGKYYRANIADAEKLKRKAMGAIEKDRHNLQGPRAELHPVKKEVPPTPVSAPPAPQSDDREAQIAKVKRLGEAAVAANNAWLVTFCKSIVFQLSQGRTLSEKQNAVLEKNYKLLKVAHSPMRERVVRRFQASMNRAADTN